jgi:2-keto-4-pentenoate hydratase/2-oxohepta-3-ene-1,7-dioic acid hydratase in catechol pathway
MRLITFSHEGIERLGVLDGEQVVDVGAVAGAPRSVLDVVAAGAAGLDRLASLLGSAPRLPVGEVKLKAPISRPPRNIFCVGKNYHEHAHEFHNSGFDASAGKSAIPEHPIIFSKPYTTVIGPGEKILGHLDPTQSVDYENELAIVIGREGRGISKADAYDYVFGYTIVNDVTARVLQQQHKQWFIGKGIDTFCPMGPCILTRDEVPSPESMELTTYVNGELRQRARVKDLIFDIPTLISVISAGTTLVPGDIIATGTPSGVGIGFTPPRYLKRGDVVRASIEPIGELVNEVA